MTSNRAWKTTPTPRMQPYLDYAYRGPAIPGSCLCFTEKHIASGQKLTKNQECHQMGRRATVLSIRGGENDPTGLPEPLGLFLDPKMGKKKIVLPPWPPCWGQPLRACYTGCHIALLAKVVWRCRQLC